MFARSLPTWLVVGLLLLAPLEAFWLTAPPLVPNLLPIYAAPGLYASDIPLLALILLALSHRHVGRIRLPPPPVREPIVILLALGLIMLLGIPFALVPPLALYTTARWLLAGCALLVLLRVAPPLPQVVSVFLVGLLCHTLIGIGQMIRQGPLGLPGEMALAAIVEGAAVLDLDGRPWLRPYGLTFHPNILGGYLAAGLCLGMPLLARRPFQIIWACLWVGLFFTFSRSAWLATLLVLPTLGLWYAWHHPQAKQTLGRLAALVALILLISGAMVSKQIVIRLNPTATPTEQRSLNERLELTQVALGILASRPITGVGAGNFPLVVRLSPAKANPQPVHNIPLLIASETGIMGAALWLWLWVVTLGRPWHRALATPWAIATTAAWFTLCIISLFDSYPWALNSGRLLTVTLLAFLYLSEKEQCKP